MTNQKKSSTLSFRKIEVVMLGIISLGVILSSVVVLARNLGSANIAPYDNFLTAPISKFGDFYGVDDEWNRFGWTGIGYGISYLPAMYIFVEFFQTIGTTPQSRVLFYLVFTFLLSIFLITKILKSRTNQVKVFYCGIFLISYPIMMIYSTGNLEGLVLIFSFTWLLLVTNRKYWQSSIVLGFAVSIKLIPIVFLLSLFVILSKRSFFKNFLIVIGTAAVSNIVALLFLPTGLVNRGLLSITEIVKNIKGSQEKYAELMYFSESGTHFGHSFLNGVHAYFGENVFPTREYWLIVFVAVVFMGITPLLLDKHSRLKEVSMQRALLSLSILGCLSLPTSTDYKLWYLFVPILFQAGSRKGHIDRATVFASIVLFAKPYWYSGTQPWASATAYLNPLILSLALIWLCLSSLFFFTKDFRQVRCIA
jgi:hypothetical protein